MTDTDVVPEGKKSGFSLDVVTVTIVTLICLTVAFIWAVWSSSPSKLVARYPTRGAQIGRIIDACNIDQTQWPLTTFFDGGGTDTSHSWNVSTKMFLGDTIPGHDLEPPVESVKNVTVDLRTGAVTGCP